MWHLCRASPFQISLIGVCPLLRFPHPGDYPQLHKACPALGRSEMIKSAMGRHARVQMVAGPRAPGQHALAPPISPPDDHQVALPLRQPRPSQAATPYQQAVHPPGKSTGRGVTVDSPSDRAVPVAGQTTQDCRRQQTRGRGDRGQSPRGCTRGNIKCSLNYHLGSHSTSMRQPCKGLVL